MEPQAYTIWEGKLFKLLQYLLNVCYKILIDYRSLRRLADHGDKVSLRAFVKGLHDIEMGSVDEATRIFKAFESDYTGFIDMNQFLFDIRYLSQVNIIFEPYEIG